MNRLVLASLIFSGLSCSLAACGSSEPDPSDECADGREACPCFDNGTCNAGLECLSSICVSNPDAGGGTGTGGNAATGGNTSSGGTSSTGGNQMSSGGTATGSGGAADCGDTQSDRRNCGSCGHECTGAAQCVNGTCEPNLQGCFLEDAFPNCDAFCDSIGETCAFQACGELTYQRVSTTDDCESLTATPSTFGTTACDAPFEGAAAYIQCCCSDTQ